MLRFWLCTFLVLSATAAFSTASSAQDAPKLAQECIDAKITMQADCDALLKKLGKPLHKPADKTKGTKPANASSGPQPALPKVCSDAGIKTQADCDTFEVAQKAKVKPAALPPKPQVTIPGPASTPAPAQPSPSVSVAPKGTSLPKDCVAAGITTEAACTAFHADHGSKAKPLNPLQSKPLQPATTSNTPIPQPGTKHVGAPLPKDCLAAGLATQADCDALHATEKAKLHLGPDLNAKNSNAVNTEPLQPVSSAPPAATPAPTGQKGSGAVLSPECLAAGLKTQADCDALHAMQKAKAKGAAASSPASAPASQPAITAPAAPTLGTKPPALAADCVAAGIKTKQDCDAYHLTKTKSLPSTSDSASPSVQRSAQPRQVIPVLPKGVTQAQVAPLLDSANQSKTGPFARNASPAATPALSAPPTTDKTAQAAVKLTPPPAIEAQPGTPVKISDKTASIKLPPNVTVVNQTIINNITTTNVTNNNAGQPTTHPQPPPAPNPIGLSIGVVLQIGGGQLVVDSSGRDQYRIADQDHDSTTYDRLSQGRYRETILRPDGTRIVTIYDRDGDVLRRSRFDPDGREIVLAYYDYSKDPDLGQWRDPGADLPPLQLRVPVQDYVLDADQADAGQIQQFFSRPPVEPLHRLYSISEVERSARLRDILPRVELGDLTFDTGSADLGTDQIGALSSVANAMLALLQQNAAETFLIEGHTDAVGSDASNLVLSDARAASVAQILTQAYHIPPENLATQGYGAHFLKIQIDGPERLNRRVVIRRITPLITASAGQ